VAGKVEATKNQSIKKLGGVGGTNYNRNESRRNRQRQPHLEMRLRVDTLDRLWKKVTIVSVSVDEIGRKTRGFPAV